MNVYRTPQQYLTDGVKLLQCAEFSETLFQYVLLLQKWNSAYNLTAVRELDAMITKHIFDSLAIRPWLRGKRIIDVGTGAGLPGVPLAITYPHHFFTLIDSNGKKVRFLQEVKRQLDLKNLEIVQCRVENYRPVPGFDTVISRAFSNLAQMIHWTEHLVANQGMWLAMKGRYPEDEIAAITYSYHVQRYSVLDIEAERCCVLIDKE